MKTKLGLLFILFTTTAFSQFNTSVVVNQKKSAWHKFNQNFSATYFTDLSGPTLANNNGGTRTWNRFYSGTDENGFTKDASANYKSA